MIILRFLLHLLRLNRYSGFKPDIILEDGHVFSEYGFDARIIHISGHSKGSIRILTEQGDLF